MTFSVKCRAAALQSVNLARNSCEACREYLAKASGPIASAVPVAGLAVALACIGAFTGVSGESAARSSLATSKPPSDFLRSPGHSGTSAEPAMFIKANAQRPLHFQDTGYKYEAAASSRNNSRNNNSRDSYGAVFLSKSDTMPDNSQRCPAGHAKSRIAIPRQS